MRIPPCQMLTAFDAFVLPGGYETRGAEGMIDCGAALPGSIRFRFWPLAWVCRWRLLEVAQNLLGFARMPTSAEIDPQDARKLLFIYPMVSNTGRYGARPMLRLGGSRKSCCSATE